MLEQQRAENEPDPDAPANERAEDGLAPLINNTGDDGGAASG